MNEVPLTTWAKDLEEILEPLKEKLAPSIHFNLVRRLKSFFVQAKAHQKEGAWCCACAHDLRKVQADINSAIKTHAKRK